MIDWRQPKLRRRGELNGPVDYDRMFEWTVWLLIVLAVVYISFTGGRHFESVQNGVDRELLQELQIEKAMERGGPLHYWFLSKDKLYYVINPKDIDNPKKWIRRKVK